MIFPLAVAAATLLSPLVATAALSLSLVAAASTMTHGVTNRSRRPEQSKPHNVQERLQLHDELKLDTAQETVWTRVEKDTWDIMRNARDRLREHDEETLVQLSQPGVDLRVVLKRATDRNAESQEWQTVSHQRWLTVYDALNLEQKEAARLFFKHKLERMAREGQYVPGRERQK